jgi:hypothetical protein
MHLKPKHVYPERLAMQNNLARPPSCNSPMIQQRNRLFGSEPALRPQSLAKEVKRVNPRATSYGQPC